MEYMVYGSEKLKRVVIERYDTKKLPTTTDRLKALTTTEGNKCHLARKGYPVRNGVLYCSNPDGDHPPLIVIQITSLKIVGMRRVQCLVAAAMEKGDRR